MQPEDIDKLFREKLERHAPPPPDYLWAQLEAELQPARKRPIMWLYASAAVITLLMLAGGAWLWRGANLDPAVGTVAKVATQPATKTPEAVSSKNSSSQATLPAAQPSTLSEAAVATAPTKQPELDAQPAQPLRSKPAATRQLARATAVPRSSSPKTLIAKPAQNTMVATLTPTKAQPERPVTEETQPNAPQQLPTVATASAIAPSVPTGPIEVEVRHSSATAALAATQQAPRRGRLGGQVMRQVSNALRGEPVTLPRLPEDVTVTVRPPGANHALVIQL
ncbi:hypothetical protein H8B13_03630 [Hymenobacter sp. BT188]|uniref:hypothetical protein n=1 Tax=Hymenobacter sp. BT188 TaxID=2763504 RepID=UPI0016510802|nr:hypothetical protein [Hymenobacter sp. BT188]MBC6605900.1 hypothetical protein [Hymenobacter sp. BT188]